MKLSQCVAATGGELVNGDCAFTSLSTDTRHIKAGDLFVALRGKNFDAHNFLQDAIDAGACGLVVEQPTDMAVPQLVVGDTTLALGAIAAEKRLQFQGTLIAITGSSGKTGVKGMLAAILKRCGPTSATQGNFNNQIGVPLTLMAIKPEDEYAVVEMGTNSPGEIGYLANLAKPDIALVNNIMAAHIGGFGSLAAIAKEKAQIYRTLTAEDTAVINLNEDFAPFFLETTKAAKQIGFYLEQPNAPVAGLAATIHADAITEDSLGRSAFELAFGSQKAKVQLGVLGRHNVANALAAASCAFAAGAGIQAVREGLESYTGDSGRLQIGKAFNGAVLINDTYNANPGSVRAAVDYLAARPQPKILVLGNLGELGDEAPQLHAELGVYAREAGIDQLFTCGDLAQEAATAFGEGAQHFASQEALIEAIEFTLQPAMVVLVKGSRSARMENIVTALSQAGEQ